MQRGQIPIPFSVSRRNYLSNLRAVVADPLTEEEMQLLSRIDRNCRLIKGDVFSVEGEPDVGRPLGRKRRTYPSLVATPECFRISFEGVLKFAADFLNAVADVLEPSFDLFGAELDRFACLLAGFLESS